jgi:hypothetical protein
MPPAIEPKVGPITELGPVVLLLLLVLLLDVLWVCC